MTSALLCVLLAAIPMTWAQCGGGELFDSTTNRCLQFYRPKVSFDQAEAICGSSQGHLVSITSAIANSFIAGRALQYFDGSDQFWVGAKATAPDVTNPNNWGWSDGASWSFQNWKPGEPTSKGDTSCATMQASSAKWQTSDCSTNFAFVCSFSVNLGTCPPPAIPSHCPSTYTYFEPTDACYKNTVRMSSWSDARSSCLADGGDLASIHTQAENDFLVELSKTGMSVKDDHYTEQVWIGFVYVSGKWTWTDGSDVTFVNWGDGEPNYLQTDWWCSLMADPHPGKNPEYQRWNNVGIADQRAFLCKRPALH